MEGCCKPSQPHEFKYQPARWLADLVNIRRQADLISLIRFSSHHLIHTSSVVTHTSHASHHSPPPRYMSPDGPSGRRVGVDPPVRRVFHPFCPACLSPWHRWHFVALLTKRKPSASWQCVFSDLSREGQAAGKIRPRFSCGRLVVDTLQELRDGKLQVWPGGLAGPASASCHEPCASISRVAVFAPLLSFSHFLPF